MISHLVGDLKAVNSIALGFVCIALLASCDDDSAKTSADAFIERAIAQQAAGHLKASVIELKNAVQQWPEGVQPRLLLAEIYVDLGDGFSSLKELERVRELGESGPEVSELRARAHILVGEFQAALSDVEEALDGQDEEAAGTLSLQGEALAGLNQIDAAEEAFGRSLEKGSTPEAHYGLARVAMLRGDLKSADVLLESGSSLHPDDAALSYLRGQWHLESGHLDEALAAFGFTLEKQPNHLQAGIGRARVLLAQRKLDELAGVLEGLSKQAPELIAVPLLRSLAALEAGDNEEALRAANAVLAKDGRNLGAIYAAGRASYEIGNLEQANDFFMRYIGQRPGDQHALETLARIKLKLNLDREAYTLLAEAAGQPDAEQSLISLAGMLAVRSGEVRTGLQFLEKASLRVPEDAALQAQLGLIRIAAGQTAEGTTSLERAFELDPALKNDPKFQDSAVAAILGHLRRNDFATALELAQKLMRDEPENTQALVLGGIAQMGLNEEETARKLFKKALEIAPGSTDAGANLAQLEIRVGNFDEAESYLKTIIELHPGHLRTLSQLADLALLRNRPEEREQWLSDAVDANPDSVDTRVALAQHFLVVGNADRALEVLLPTLGTDPRNPAVLETVGKAQLTRGNPEQAARAFRQWSELRPELPDPLLNLGESLVAQRELEGARKEFEGALQIDPRYHRARVALVQVLLEQRDAEAARRELDILRAALPENALQYELEGRLASLESNFPEAISRYKRAQQLHFAAGATPAASRLASLVARAQWRSGQREQSVATLQDWVKTSPNDTSASVELAAYLVEMGRSSEAREVYSAAIESDKVSWLARNDYAWFLYQAGDFEDALQQAEAAYVLEPRSPAVKDTLGVVLLEVGDPERAGVLFREALDQQPDNPETTFHLAKALSQTGQAEEARRLLKGLFDRAEPFGSMEEAQKLLESLGS